MKLFYWFIYMVLDCTVQEECRCPEGYMKTADGFSCLLIADEKVVCSDASKM